MKDEREIALPVGFRLAQVLLHLIMPGITQLIGNGFYGQTNV